MLPWRVVPPASHKLTGVRGTQESSRATRTCRATGLSPAVAVRSSTFASCRVTVLLVLQPRPDPKESGRFGHFPVRSPLLGESRLIACRQATEMFQLAYLPPPCLCVRHGVSRHHSGGVAPLGISGLSACMQLPLNVSPVSASFIGLVRLGIHRVLSRACLLGFLAPGCLRVMCAYLLVCIFLALARDPLTTPRRGVKGSKERGDVCVCVISRFVSLMVILCFNSCSRQN